MMLSPNSITSWNLLPAVLQCGCGWSVPLRNLVRLPATFACRPDHSATIRRTAHSLLIHKKNGGQLSTNLYCFRLGWREARYEQKKGGKWRLYIGWIIVAVVVISPAATVITIRFDFIWECLHSCSPLAPLTPFPPSILLLYPWPPLLSP